MSSDYIYGLAISKVKSLHYFNRYIKFINNCRIINNDIILDYSENHHILPKAFDLFPEFMDLTLNPWNSIKLTFRQHVIAHVMLWKIFGGSQIFALFGMISSNNSIKNKNRKIPSSIEIRYLEKIKLEYRDASKNKSYYYDENKKLFFLHIDDPLIKELNLRGNTAGSKWYNDGENSFKVSKENLPNPNWIEGRIIKFSDEVLKLYSEKALGSNVYNDGDKNYFVKVGDRPQSHWEKGMIRDELKMAEASRKRSIRFSNSKWYNDGIKNFNVSENDIPNPDWTERKLCNFSENGLKSLSKKAKDSRYYNDGIKNYKVFIGEEPDPAWIRGILVDEDKKSRIAELNRKKSTGSKWYNNGVKNFIVFANQEPQEDWVRGMISHKKS